MDVQDCDVSKCVALSVKFLLPSAGDTREVQLDCINICVKQISSTYSEKFCPQMLKIFNVV